MQTIFNNTFYEIKLSQDGTYCLEIFSKKFNKKLACESFATEQDAIDRAAVLQPKFE